MDEELISKPLERSYSKRSISFQCMHQKVRPIGRCEKMKMNREEVLFSMEIPARVVHSHHAVNRREY